METVHASKPARGTTRARASGSGPETVRWWCRWTRCAPDVFGVVDEDVFLGSRIDENVAMDACAVLALEAEDPDAEIRVGNCVGDAVCVTAILDTINWRRVGVHRRVGMRRRTAGDARRGW